MKNHTETFGCGCAITTNTKNGNVERVTLCGEHSYLDTSNKTPQQLASDLKSVKYGGR